MQIWKMMIGRKSDTSTQNVYITRLVSHQNDQLEDAPLHSYL